jgi:hypothetical protein
MSDQVLELAILRCTICRNITLRRHQPVTAYGATDLRCPAPETDEALRQRLHAGKKLYRRMLCDGQLVLVEDNDAALAAYQLGGYEALDPFRVPR